MKLGHGHLRSAARGYFTGAYLAASTALVNLVEKTTSPILSQKHRIAAKLNNDVDIPGLPVHTSCIGLSSSLSWVTARSPHTATPKRQGQSCLKVSSFFGSRRWSEGTNYDRGIGGKIMDYPSSGIQLDSTLEAGM